MVKLVTGPLVTMKISCTCTRGINLKESSVMVSTWNNHRVVIEMCLACCVHVVEEMGAKSIDVHQKHQGKRIIQTLINRRLLFSYSGNI